MKPITASRSIDAPINVIFQTVSEPEKIRCAVPPITEIEFLSETRHGVGTRFRQGRMMNGREVSCVLELTQFVVNQHVRMFCDQGGTIWDSVFTTTQQDDHVVLDLHMDIKPHTLFAKIITPLIRRQIFKGVQSDMDAIKAYCESSSPIDPASS